MRLINFFMLFMYIFCFSLIMKNVNSQYIFISNENSDTVSVLNANDKKFIKTIETGGRPRDMKFNIDKTKLYLVVSEENHIAIIDTVKLEIIKYIECGDDPEIFDISPDGQLIAVSNEDDNELTIISTENNKILKKIEDVGVEPEGVNFSPDGKYIFVTSEGTNSIIIISVKREEIIDEVLVGNRPRRGIFINNGEEYWVSNELSGTVSVIDPKTFKVIKTLKFSIKGIRDQNITPVDFAYSPNLKKVYVTMGSANHVAVVNSENYEIEKYILTGSRSWGAALTRNDEELIITNGNSDDISIINIEKQISTQSIPVGKTPHTVRVLK